MSAYKHGASQTCNVCVVVHAVWDPVCQESRVWNRRYYIKSSLVHHDQVPGAALKSLNVVSHASRSPGGSPGRAAVLGLGDQLFDRDAAVLVPKTDFGRSPTRIPRGSMMSDHAVSAVAQHETRHFVVRQKALQKMSEFDSAVRRLFRNVGEQGLFEKRQAMEQAEQGMPRLEEVLLPPDERSRSSGAPAAPPPQDHGCPSTSTAARSWPDADRIPVEDRFCAPEGTSHENSSGNHAEAIAPTFPTTRGSPFKRGKLPHTGKPFLPKGKTAIAAPFYPEPLAEEITPFSLSFLDLRKHVPRELLESMLAHFEVHHFSGISAQEFIQMARMAGDGTGGGG